MIILNDAYIFFSILTMIIYLLHVYKLKTKKKNSGKNSHQLRVFNFSDWKEMHRHCIKRLKISHYDTHTHTHGDDDYDDDDVVAATALRLSLSIGCSIFMGAKKKYIILFYFIVNWFFFSSLLDHIQFVIEFYAWAARRPAMKRVWCTDITK